MYLENILKIIMIMQFILQLPFAFQILFVTPHKKRSKCWIIITKFEPRNSPGHVGISSKKENLLEWWMQLHWYNWVVYVISMIMYFVCSCFRVYFYNFCEDSYYVNYWCLLHHSAELDIKENEHFYYFSKWCLNFHVGNNLFNSKNNYLQ